MSGASGKVGELVRQLSLLPYFQQHEGRSVMEAARDLGLESKEIMTDLNRLWMCGLPGLLPGDLVELEHSLSSVRVFNAQGMDKPLRLTPMEAGVLLLTLESLENFPGLMNQEAVVSAAAKLREIVGESATAVYDSTAGGRSTEVLSALGQATDRGVQVEFTYFSHSRDETSRRQVSPTQVFTNEGETYLHAWEDAVSGHRIFRIDRIRDITLTAAPADPHRAEMQFSPEDPFAFERAGEEAEFLLREDGVWLASYMAMEVDTTDPALIDGAGRRWFRVSYPLLSREWFLRFAISHGNVLSVTGPQELKEQIAEKVRAGLSAYDSDVK